MPPDPLEREECGGFYRPQLLEKRSATQGGTVLADIAYDYDRAIRRLWRGDPGACGDLAWAIRRAASMPRRWIAERMGLRRAANVCQCLRRFESLETRTLPKEIGKWKQEMSRIVA